MTGPRVAATRMNLVRAARQLGQVQKGIDLLRRKREVLVVELFRLGRPAAEARTEIAARARRAYPALLAGLARHGAAGLAALGWPLRDLSLEMRSGSVWGVPIAELVTRPPVARTLAARGTAPGGLGPAAALAATEFEGLVELLLDAAPREMLIRRLGEGLAQTSRQVNTLERRVAPGLRLDMTVVRRALEEREREERLRLKRLVSARGAQGPRAR